MSHIISKKKKNLKEQLHGEFIKQPELLLKQSNTFSNSIYIVFMKMKIVWKFFTDECSNVAFQRFALIQDSTCSLFYGVSLYINIIAEPAHKDHIRTINEKWSSGIARTHCRPPSHTHTHTSVENRYVINAYIHIHTHTVKLSGLIHTIRPCSLIAWNYDSIKL